MQNHMFEPLKPFFSDEPIIGQSKTCCPHQEIGELFNRTCPDLPAVRHVSCWPLSRKVMLMSAWRAYPSLEVWLQAFTKTSKSDYLNGRVHTSPGSNGWRASFDWVIKRDKFEKILEGNYDTRQSEAASFLPALPSVPSDKGQRIVFPARSRLGVGPPQAALDTASVPSSADSGWVLTPKVPSPQQRSGLALVILGWMTHQRPTPATLFALMADSGFSLPKWLLDEPEMQWIDKTPSAGAMAALVYMSMTHQQEL